MGWLCIREGITVEINGLSLRDGRSLRDNGGAIQNDGILTVRDCIFAGNDTDMDGGAIYNKGTLTALDCTFMDNAALDGGAIYNDDHRTASVSGCTFAGNATGGIASSSGDGGAIFNSGRLNVINSLFHENFAENGGAIVNTNARLHIANSTISGNRASNRGGGISISEPSSVTIINVTIAENIGDGGGIHNVFGGVTMHNSIVSGNVSGQGEVPSDIAGRTTVKSVSSYNIIGHSDSSGGLAEGINENRIGVNPMLGSLRDLGGSTLVHPLLFGSPAIDAGSNSLAVDSNGQPLTTDQRGVGFDRVRGTAIDLGAYEFSEEDRGSLLGPLQDASDLGQGWKWLEWFGSYNDGNFPWIFHAEHAWLYCVEDSESSTFCYDLALDNWLWISRNSYPSIYKFGANSGWMWYYIGGTSGSRRFHHFGMGRDVEEAQLLLDVEPVDTDAGTTVCVPELISPAAEDVMDNGRSDSADEIVWDFLWADCPGATEYHLYVIGSTASIPIINAEGIADSSFHHVKSGSYITFANRFGWRWKVRALVDGEWGNWSEERSFDVEPVNTDPRP